MVLGEQQQSLAVDLLHPESLRYVAAAWNSNAESLKTLTEQMIVFSHTESSHGPDFSHV